MGRCALFLHQSSCLTEGSSPAIDGELVQTLTHPAISVWTVATMPNGDIVTGCSDGVVRVFSRNESRWANAEAIQVSL
jgi:hypothetical protein